MKKKTIGGKELALALLAMVLGAFAASGVVAVLTGKQILPETMAPNMSIILTELLVLLVCYFNVRKLPQSRLPAALLLVAPFLVVRLFSGFFLLEGEGSAIIRCLFTVVAAATAGLLASGKKQRRR